ncbi:cytochrome P450 [Pseudofrankia sp. DC12]|uniref:cytochrome P450 n=1 Tax=Pseudofrankia sp. DC12 TaxID=683315 RepID=UPI000ADF500A|nr:cytochrome P450 [Pseudofrankia sp. DC12]
MTADVDLRHHHWTIDEEVAQYLNADHPDRAEITRDPYPFFDRLRAHAPVYRTASGPVLVTSYQATQGLVRDRRWSREEMSGAPGVTPTQRVFLESLAFRDPPKHTVLRGLLAGLFTPKSLEASRADVRDIVRGLLAELRGRDHFDFIQDFSYLVPLRLICRLVGVPLSLESEFIAWGDALIGSLEPLPQAAEVAARRETTARECFAFFTELIRERRARPGGSDIISQLLAARDEEGRFLTDEEIIANCMLLHSAGFSTTRNLISNGMYLLLRNPASYAELRSDPGVIPSAVEEMLRCEGPARNSLRRTAPEDTGLGGLPIQAGESVYAILAAANRDPAAFDDPHTFNIRRAGPRQVAFGGGIHLCLGQSLARLEATIAFAHLAEAPRLEADVDALEWIPSFLTRGLASFPVRWA